MDIMDIVNLNVPKPPGPPGINLWEVSHIRWGHNSCLAADGTKTVYSGNMAASDHTGYGGGANYSCILEYKFDLKYRMYLVLSSLFLLGHHHYYTSQT